MAVVAIHWEQQQAAVKRMSPVKEYQKHVDDRRSQESLEYEVMELMELHKVIAEAESQA
jgi:hypothetical protein